MVPNVERGYSFKGVSLYLMHDKREPAPAEAGDSAAPDPELAERVGFFRLFNLDPGEARDPAEAAKVMALTVRDAEHIKRAAGIRTTGRKATEPPVWHASLSWTKGEEVTQGDKMLAVERALAAVGLGLDRGHQTYIVEHTDTAHPHVHIVVNLVHPLTGKQANPHRDQQKLQSWARNYDRQRGTIYCHAREAKYAALDRTRENHATKTRAAFNDNALGPGLEAGTPCPSAKPAPASAGEGHEEARDRFGRSRERKPRAPRNARGRQKGQQHPEWQARQQAGDENAAAQEAADRIKAGTAAKWAALKTAERAAFAQRSAESARFYADSKAERNAIAGKYRAALDAVWKSPACAGPGGGAVRASGPDRSLLRQRVRRQQSVRRRCFETNERSFFGRMRNATALAGRGSGLLRRLRLALDRGERRRMFDRSQRLIARRALPGTPPASAGAGVPKRVQAERLKAMRAAELAAYGRCMTAQRAAMKARHEFQLRAEKAARETLSRNVREAWEAHRATFGRPPPAGETESREPKTADRFGRSRERQHRRPRAAGRMAARAENPPVEPGKLARRFRTGDSA